MARQRRPTVAPMAPLRPPPPPPAPFVGRATDLAALVAQLDERGVAVLTGVTGAGKTALLAALAAQVRRPVEWIEVYAGLSDGSEALFWQVTRPLADLRPEPWQMLHQLAQATPPYPLAVRLQVALAAYADVVSAPLLIIDSAEHLGEREAAALLVALCDHVAAGRAGALHLAVAGRFLPYKLRPYSLPPLAGLDAPAVQAWATALRSPLAEAQLAALLVETGGVPLALADRLRSGTAHPLAPESEARLWAMLAGLAPSERELLVALTHDPDLATLPLERRATLARLEALHLVSRGAEHTVSIHPMVHRFMIGQPIF